MKRNSKKILSSAAAILLSLTIFTGALPDEIFNTDNYSLSASADGEGSSSTPETVTYDNEITYQLNGGTNSASNPKGFNNNDDQITLFKH